MKNFTQPGYLLKPPGDPVLLSKTISTYFFKRKIRMLTFILFIKVSIFSLPVLAQAVLVNYDFGSANTGCISNPYRATGITSVLTTSLSCIGDLAGVAVSTPTSFVTNAGAGNCIAMKSPIGGGFDNDYFQFKLGGSNLVNYGAFKVFYNYKVDNSITTLNFQYSTDGTSWTTFSTITTTAGSWISRTEDLSNVSAINLKANIYFRIQIPNVGGAKKDAYIDNFQVNYGCATLQQVSIPASIIQCDGSSVSMMATVTGGNGPLTYQWKKNNNSINGATNSSYTIPAIALSDSGNYSVVASNLCSSVSSLNLKLSVNPLPVISLSAAAVCFSNSNQNLGLNFNANGNPNLYSINWNAAALSAGFVNINNANLPLGTINISVAANTLPATYSGAITVSNFNNCNSISKNFSVTVNPIITGNTVNENQTICSGFIPAIITGNNLSGGNLSYTYLWQSSSSSAVDGFATAAGIYNAANYSPANLSQKTWFRRTVQSGGCADIASAIKIDMYPANQWVGGATGSWNVPSNWCGGVPTAAANISIPANTIIYIESGNAFANSITIATGSSLEMRGASNLSISVGGSLINNGNFNATDCSGKIIFLGNTLIVGTTSFKNIDAFGTIDFGLYSTITGAFTLQPGAVVVANAAVYSYPSSTLIYNNGGTLVRGLEWTSNAVGYPSNVIIQNNTIINFSVTGDGYVYNDLIIEHGAALRMDYAAIAAKLYIGKTVIINGTLVLGNEVGGNIYVGGNWIRNNTGVFINNDREVIFDGPDNFNGNGNATSSIFAPASNILDNDGAYGGEKFAYLLINKSTVADSVLLLSNITITREMVFEKGNFVLGNYDVNLVSNQSRTADIAPITPTSDVEISYDGTGRFIIQRFISNPTSLRSWRLLTAPLQAASAPTVNAAFQQGVVNPDKNNPNGSAGIYNPMPGYGTHITGPGGVYNEAAGFDQGTSSSSILIANPGANSWSSPSATTGYKVTDKQGWMLFIRGDRSFVIGTQYVPAQNTTLAPKGKINWGNISVPVVAEKIVLGNPYPSAISLLNVDFAGTLGRNSTYYMWDPKAQPGRWVTFTGMGNSFVQTSSVSNYTNDGTIESGQAFLVNMINAGNAIFQESDKKPLASSLVGISNGNAQLQSNSTSYAMLRTDLFSANRGEYILADGVLNVFDAGYSNRVDEADAKKLNNIDAVESLSILRNGEKLAIEKRKTVQSTDSIFFAINGLQNGTYQFRINASNFNPLTAAYLEDKFKGNQTSINILGNTNVDFEITADPLSKVSDRFSLVFKTLSGAAPVRFCNQDEWIKDNGIAVEWKVANEINIDTYDIEKSTDGLHFKKINSIASIGNSTAERTYKWVDAAAEKGNNYYRVISKGIDKKQQTSKVAMVNANKINGKIILFPNPVNGGIMRLKFLNMPVGNYSLRLINGLGKTESVIPYYNTGANGIKEILLSESISKGIYLLEISKPGNDKTEIKVIVN